jgi:transcriptional regulator with XRE-family HTH domain
MMIQQSTAEDVKARMAANLRRLRIANHLSLSALARATSTSKATLSAIENGRGNPTVETLALLAGALRVSIADLVEEAQAGEVHIVRASQVGAQPPDGVGERQLDAIVDLHGSVSVCELSLPAHHVHEMPARAPGSRQSIFVLRGKLIAGPVERVTELAVGDYASFPADTPCLYEAGRTAARALVSFFAPSTTLG